MRRLLQRLACLLGGHRIPDGVPEGRRWATCGRCGEVFDVALQRDFEHERMQY